MKASIICIALLLLSSATYAAVHTEAVEYKIGDSAFEGYIAYDDSTAAKRPGVLIIHEWWGLNDYIKKRAEMLASLGYVAFAGDIYGKGIRPKNAEEASRLAGQYLSDRALLRERASAALKLLRENKLADSTRLAAIGYCFGGTTALELARSGSDLRGVVSFHGGLDTPRPEDAKSIKGSVLALHGADDPFVTAERASAFQDEMRKAGVDWQMVYYGGAVHSFTNPASGTDKSKGVAYNEKADRRSFKAMKVFLKEIFQHGLIMEGENR